MDRLATPLATRPYPTHTTIRRDLLPKTGPRYRSCGSPCLATGLAPRAVAIAETAWSGAHGGADGGTSMHDAGGINPEALERMGRIARTLPGHIVSLGPPEWIAEIAETPRRDSAVLRIDGVAGSEVLVP